MPVSFEIKLSEDHMYDFLLKHYYTHTGGIVATAAGILSTTIEKVRQLVDVSTIVGEPIALSDEITVIPVSKVTYGFASGGSDFPSKNNTQLFGGGGGASILRGSGGNRKVGT